MDIGGLLRDGAELMVLGMFVVFSLLGLLVVAMKGMTRLARALEGTPAPAAAPLPPAGDPDLIAAVTAAVHAYRGGPRPGERPAK